MSTKYTGSYFYQDLISFYLFGSVSYSMMSSEARPRNRVKKKVSFVGVEKKPAFGLLQFITLKVTVYIRTVSS